MSTKGDTILKMAREGAPTAEIVKATGSGAQYVNKLRREHKLGVGRGGAPRSKTVAAGKPKKHTGYKRKHGIPTLQLNATLTNESGGVTALVGTLLPDQVHEIMNIITRK